MAVRVSKPAFNLRDKLSELDRPVGNHGYQLMKSGDGAESFGLIGAGRKNMIINGAMDIDQRKVGDSNTISTNYYLDRWKWEKSNDGAATVQRVSDAPPGFTHSMKFTVTSNDTSFSSNQYMYVRQMIEGNNFKSAGFGTDHGKNIALSFYVKSSLSGKNFGGSLWNNAFNQSYPFEYEIENANAWERKTIIIPPERTGTWETGIERGVNLGFSMGMASNYEGPTGRWNSSASDLAPEGGMNIMYTNGATWQITGVRVEVGDVATPFEHRSFGEELALCMRYYQKSFMLTDAPGTAAHQGGIHVLSWGDGNAAGIILPVRMRDAGDWRLWPTNSTNVGKVSSHGTERDAIVKYPAETGYSFIEITSGTNSTYVRFQYDVDAEL